MKTRKKKTDEHKNLGISDRSKNIPNKSKLKQPFTTLSRSREKAADVNVSDKENVSNQSAVVKVANPERRVLSPLVLSQSKQEINLRGRNVILSPLASGAKGTPGATSTPNVVRRTLFLEVSAATEEPAAAIVLSDDSDCTDTEFDGVHEETTGN